MKSTLFSRAFAAIAAFIVSAGIFFLGYSHGHSDGVMSASAVTASQLRAIHNQMAATSPEKTRAALLQMADHSLMLNAETYRLGPWLSGLMVKRQANFEIMQRYAQYRVQQADAPVAQDPTLQRALDTFSK